MSIKCGYCPNRHETVAEVRSCAASLDDRSFDVLIQERERSEDEAVAAFKMRRFMGEADTPETSVQRYKRNMASLAAGNAAAARIEDHGRFNTERRGPKIDAPSVANGRYAVEEDGTLKFFHVRNGSGRWAGYVFIDIQASDDRYAVKDRARKASILRLIAADPAEALCRYGRELGQCGHCGRTLTDEASRAAGIGPVCAGKI